jgi:hypothetical protein
MPISNLLTFSIGNNNCISILDSNGNKSTPPTIAIDIALDKDNKRTILDVSSSLYRSVLNISALIKLLLVRYYQYLWAFVNNSPFVLTAIDAAIVAGFSSQGILNLYREAVSAGQDLNITKLPCNKFERTCSRLILTAPQRSSIERF